jgi:hypothetical protein
LNAAEGDQLVHVATESAERGAGEEEHDRELEDVLAPEEFGNLAVERVVTVEVKR